MVEQEEKDAAPETLKTMTLNFESLGKFTVREPLTGETSDALEEVAEFDEVEGKIKVNSGLVNLFKLNACLVDSPKGPHPGIKYLRSLRDGVTVPLIKEMNRLSKVPYTIEKN